MYFKFNSKSLINKLVVNFWTRLKVRDIASARPVARPIIVRFWYFLLIIFYFFYAGDSLRCPRCFLPPVTASSKKSPLLYIGLVFPAKVRGFSPSPKFDH